VLATGSGETKNAGAFEIGICAGKCHGRVERNGARAAAGECFQRPKTVPSARMGDHLSGMNCACGRELFGDPDERIVGNRDEQNVASSGDLSRVRDRNTGDQGADTKGGHIGSTADCGDLVTGGPQFRGQDRSDAARSDHAYFEAKHLVAFPFQSRHRVPDMLTLRYYDSSLTKCQREWGESQRLDFVGVETDNTRLLEGPRREFEVDRQL